MSEVKIWDLESKKEIATLVHVDSEDWIVLGPDGLFDASPNAMSLLYYTVETNGKQEIIELEQLKARYYEPGLLQISGHAEDVDAFRHELEAAYRELLGPAKTEIIITAEHPYPS